MRQPAGSSFPCLPWFNLFSWVAGAPRWVFRGSGSSQNLRVARAGPSGVVPLLDFNASKNAAGPALFRAPGLRNLTSFGTRESARVGGRRCDSPSTIVRLGHLAGVYYCLNSKSHLPFALELPLRLAASANHLASFQSVAYVTATHGRDHSPSDRERQEGIWIRRQFFRNSDTTRHGSVRSIHHRRIFSHRENPGRRCVIKRPPPATACAVSQGA